MVKRVERPDATTARNYLVGFLNGNRGRGSKGSPIARDEQTKDTYDRLEINIGALPDLGERVNLIKRLGDIGYVGLHCFGPACRRNPMPEDQQDQSHTQQQEP